MNISKKLMSTFFAFGISLSSTMTAIAQDYNWRVDLQGYGPIRLGMTVEEASWASGKNFKILKAQHTNNHQACHYVTFN